MSTLMEMNEADESNRRFFERVGSINSDDENGVIAQRLRDTAYLLVLLAENQPREPSDRPSIDNLEANLSVAIAALMSAANRLE